MTRSYKFLILPVLLLLAAVAHGQTTVSGTVVDPNALPYRNGTVTAYVPSDSNTPTAGPTPTDNSGHFSFTIPSQVWYFKVCTPAVVAVPPNPVPYGTVCFTAGPITISGGSQSITTQLNAAAIAINPSGVTGVTTFNSRNGAVTFLASDLPNTAVTPGSYTSTNLTVDAAGRITAAANGSSASGTVTHTGALTAGHAVVGNGTADTIVDPVWTFPGSSQLVAQDDAAQIIVRNAGNTLQTSIIPGQIGLTGTGNNVIADTLTPEVAIDMSDAPADIIDSTGSHGNAGYGLISLGGSGAGVQWDPVLVVANCGTTTACAPTTNAPATLRYGSVALSSGVPSTATITGLAYTSASTYVCVVTQRSTATGNLLKVVNVDGTSFTITGPATVTDGINYICAGT